MQHFYCSSKDKNILVCTKYQIQIIILMISHYELNVLIFVSKTGIVQYNDEW